jgi:hypothetical protein
MGVFMQVFEKHGILIWAGPLLNGGTEKQVLNANEYVWITLGYILETIDRSSQDPWGFFGGEKLSFRIWTAPTQIPPVVEVNQVAYDGYTFVKDDPTTGPERAIWNTSLFKSWTETGLGGINGRGVVKKP